MDNGDLIKVLQKFGKDLPVGVHIESNLPFTYEIVDAQLESAMNVNRIFSDGKEEKEDRINLIVKIQPR